MGNRPRPPSILMSDEVEIAGFYLHLELVKVVKDLIESGDTEKREHGTKLLDHMQTYFGAVSSVIDWLDEQGE